MGIRIAIITILVIIIGVYIFLAASGSPPPASNGGWTPPPDPSLGGYIKNVQTASANLYSATQSLLKTTADIPANIDLTFTTWADNVDSKEGVSDDGPVGIKKSVTDAVSSVSNKLNGYADSVKAFDTMVQGWTVDTPSYEMMDQKAAADGLVAEILDPMAGFLTAAGGLSSFVSTWESAYPAASEGSTCIASDPWDCAPYNQYCWNGRCTALMSEAMSVVLDSISDAAKIYTTQGALNTSPFQKLANDLDSAYMALFNHLAGL